MADEEVFEIELVGLAEGRARVTFSDTASACRLTVEHLGSRLDAEAEDAFEALCAIRRRLEARGVILRCYGASLDVYPSAMSLSMGGGRMAYRLRMGCCASRSDLVDIFDAGPDVAPATVDDQRRFYEAWIEASAADPSGTA